MARKTVSPGQPQLRLAVIDADSGFVSVLAKRLEGAGCEYRTLAATPPVDALVALRLNAVVIDLAVVGPPAWAYLAALCERMPGLGVVVCTGQTSVADRVRGLRLGADDWVTKPCHPEEVVARVETVVRGGRRVASEREPASVGAGGIEIRPHQFQAFAGGVSLDLTRREFELLELLAGAGGQVLPREDIYQRVWGYAMARGDRSVDVFVRKLRCKLERASAGWHYIHTHFGVGYRFEAIPAPATAPAPAPVPTAAPAPAAPLVHSGA